MVLTWTQRVICKLAVWVCSGCLLFNPARADDITVAVAANFIRPMEAIVSLFEAESGHKVLISPGSSGRLYAQIVNGAPYDVFLSADQDKPAALVAAGQADPASRFTYAIGTLVLWSPEEGRQVEADLKAGRLDKLAMANPRLAPYGVAASEVLQRLGVSAQYQDKLVMGENINQTYQFVSTGNAQAGFLALSQVFNAGEFQMGRGWIVPSSLHSPIRQDAVITQAGRGNTAAMEFVTFMQEDAAKSIIKSFGYGTD